MTRKINIALWVIGCIASLLSFEAKAQNSATAMIIIKKDETPKGYLIANFTIKDSITFQKYREAAAGLAQKYQGRMIVRDVNSKTVEGADPKKITAIIEFPSLKQAEVYYNSPDYTKAKKFGIASADRLIILAEGIPQAARVSSGYPKGYLIANFTIHDQDTFKKYMETGGPVVGKFNGKAIVYDVKAKGVEGNGQQIIAVMEFPSFADLERFYNSAEYTSARKFRIASTKGSVILAEGMSENQKSN
jgi:uncharacterized protein (DUF1330 family)